MAILVISWNQLTAVCWGALLQQQLSRFKFQFMVKVIISQGKSKKQAKVDRVGIKSSQRRGNKR